MKLSYVHIVSASSVSFITVTDTNRELWCDVFNKMGYGWHAIGNIELAQVIHKLQGHIDELVSVKPATKMGREFTYGNQKLFLAPSNGSHSRAISLILLYNEFIESVGIDVLLLPEYGTFHEQIYSVLKKSQTGISIQGLLTQFGPDAINVINDFQKHGLVEIHDSRIQLTLLTTQILTLTEIAGSNKI